MMGPDDLIPGRTYRFEYIAVGSTQCVLAEFVKTSLDDDALWFWFLEECGEVPFEYAALNNLREVQVDD